MIFLISGENAKNATSSSQLLRQLVIE